MNLVVVTNAGSHDLFQNCELMGVVKKYFETDFNPPEALPEDQTGFSLLCRTVEELREGRTEWAGSGKAAGTLACVPAG